MTTLLQFMLCILFVVFVAIGSAIYGGVTMLKSLEHATVTQCVDGKEKLLVDLILGPFHYVINVPEKRERSPQ